MHTTKMGDCATTTPRFVRRTGLRAGEYRRNFRQIDADIITAVTSRAADAVTPLMSKIYLRLVNAPAQYWEKEGVLRFEAGVREETHVKSWDALCEVLGVASATASKALRWMHEEGIIGYFAGKNGVGIRVFINRAASSIGSRTAGKKILEFARASSREPHASTGEAAFSDSFADLEVLDTDENSRAPKNGAEKTEVGLNSSHSQQAPLARTPQGTCVSTGAPRHGHLRVEVPVDEIVLRLSRELEPSLQAAARRAAAQEHERTREWLESRGLPKAARVAQREAYDVLRKYGVIEGGSRPKCSRAEVGRDMSPTAGPSRRLTDEEVYDLAEAAVAMRETQGRPVEMTLAGMGAGAGGFLSPEDVERVREKVVSLLAGDSGGG